MAAVLDELDADESGLEIEYEASLVQATGIHRLATQPPLIVQEPAILFLMSVSDPVSSERMTGTFMSELPVVTDDFVTEVTRTLWYRVRFNLHLSLLGFEDDYSEVLGQEG